MSTEVTNPNDQWLPSAFDEWYERRCDDAACDECHQYATGLFEPGTEPTKPPADCTCIGGCHCSYVLVPYPPDDSAA